jgi:UDP-N-acetylglucosamine transferase subunit ALG13
VRAAGTDERVLFVCDSGGHLIEANEIAASRYPDAAASWYTSDTLMSRSLLAGRDVTYARRRVRPGAAWSALREVPVAVGHLRRRPVDLVVTTGSAYALPWALAARLTRHDALFVESAARTTSLSRVGRLISRVPGTRFATQAPLQIDGWEQLPSVLTTAWSRRPARPVREPGPPRLLITVGTFHFPFDRLLQQVAAVVPAEWHLTVQHGSSRPIDVADVSASEFGYDQMVAAMRSADLIIGHCGVGTLVTAAGVGAPCMMLPRRADLGEVVDDHQFDLIEVLQRLPGVTVLDAAADLTYERLRQMLEQLGALDAVVDDDA